MQKGLKTCNPALADRERPWFLAAAAAAAAALVVLPADPPAYDLDITL